MQLSVLSSTLSYHYHMGCVWHQVASNWSELCAVMGCARIRVPGAVICSYPVERSGTFYNFAVVQDPRSYVIEDAEDLFMKRKLPFAIRIPRLEPYAELEKSLDEHGYSLAPVWSLMTHEEWTGESNPEVKVDQINGSRLADWFELQNTFNHLQSTRATRRRMIERILPKRSVQLLMASLGDRPVGAGLLFLKNHVASIHMIATLAEFRRRHVATTLTLEALRRAKAEKADLIWLRTRRGGIGEKVYTKIGFRAFSDILSYTNTPETEDSNLAPK